MAGATYDTAKKLTKDILLATLRLDRRIELGSHCLRMDCTIKRVFCFSTRQFWESSMERNQRTPPQNNVAYTTEWCVGRDIKQQTDGADGRVVISTDDPCLMWLIRCMQMELCRQLISLGNDSKTAEVSINHGDECPNCSLCAHWLRSHSLIQNMGNKRIQGYDRN